MQVTEVELSLGEGIDLENSYVFFYLLLESVVNPDG